MAVPFVDDLSLPWPAGCGVGPTADAGSENYGPRGAGFSQAWSSRQGVVAGVRATRSSWPARLRGTVALAALDQCRTEHEERVGETAEDRAGGE